MKKLKDLNIVPEYELTLPSGSSIRFRQFLVKEKKLLLMAEVADTEEEKINLNLQVIESCVLNEDFDTNKLTMSDLEYLILNLRAKSLGNPIELIYTCQNKYYDEEEKINKTCNGLVQCNIDVNDVKIINKESVKAEDILLNEEIGLGIKIKIPTVKDIIKAESNADGSDVLEQILLNHITHVFDSEDMYDTSDKKELKEFIDSLKLDQLEKIEKFFLNLPRMYYENNFTCPFCGFEHKIVLERLQDFLE